MINRKHFILPLLCITVLAMHCYAHGKPSFNIHHNPQLVNLATDTIPGKKGEDTQPDDAGNRQSSSGQPAIKEVPRARKQDKPKVIEVPPVRMRPVKILKPKIVAKGVGK